MTIPKPRGLLIALALAGLGSCATPAATVTAGRDGAMRTTLTTNGIAFVVEGRAGRLFIAGEDRGPIVPGDVVTVDHSHEVHVNGGRR